MAKRASSEKPFVSLLFRRQRRRKRREQSGAVQLECLPGRESYIYFLTDLPVHGFSVASEIMIRLTRG